MPQPSCPSPHVAIAQPSASVIESIEAVATTSSAKAEEDHVVRDCAMDVDSSAPKKKKAGSNPPDESIPSNDVKTVSPKETASRLKKVAKTEEKKKLDAPQQVDKGKKRAGRPPPRDEVPKSKKARIAQAPEASGSRPATQSRSKRVEVKPSRRMEAKSVQSKGKKAKRADERNSPPPAPKTQQRKARPRSPSLSDSDSRSSSVSPEEPLPKPAPELDPELCGMLIESMATSRASSLAMSSLYKTVMQSYPSLKSRGTEDECLELIERVLEGGTVAGGGSGVFGKVVRSGKDELDPPLESQWFYVAERDPDQERAQLISSMIPRPAKRTETKKHKQYYFRPLEKISRWDPEDEL
ncbi:hypothetical protein C8R45DRAFT_38296 [Mycena sanguinolenta]|nr:hypothetical protein C8R45DRAFT_38296 [Mycena sanguinolenta]